MEFGIWEGLLNTHTLFSKFRVKEDIGFVAEDGMDLEFWNVGVGLISFHQNICGILCFIIIKILLLLLLLLPIWGIVFLININ